ncbi:MULTISPECIES: hypothetical protein [unclassified Brevundimonas]|uniref:hypothetical protein n=1 Tax=unclassified Brevundimonas TaxID=2622653 RepID=UPI003F90DEA8
MSTVTKKLIRAQAGVKLERIEHLAARQRREVCFKLSSHRATPERIIADEAEAQKAFSREVGASLEDAFVKGLIKQGGLDH